MGDCNKRRTFTLLYMMILGLSILGCSQKEKASGFDYETNGNINENGGGNLSKENKDANEYQVMDIDTNGIDGMEGEFIYDPLQGRMGYMARKSTGKKTTYTLLSFYDKKGWMAEVGDWVVEDGYFTSFDYSKEGDLYAIKNAYHENGASRSVILNKLLKKGIMEEIPLEDLNETNGTNSEWDGSTDVCYIKTMERERMAVFYSNASMKVYDLGTGKELQCIETPFPISTAVIDNDELYTISNVDRDENSKINVIDGNTGENTRDIPFEKGRGTNGNRFFLSEGTEGDFYLLAGGDVFQGELGGTKIERMVERFVSVKDVNYEYFVKGKEDDFYIAYYDYGEEESESGSLGYEIGYYGNDKTPKPEEEVEIRKRLKRCHLVKQ